MKSLKSVFFLACALAVGLALSACREEEQGRALMFDKGVYSGKPDTPVSESARRAQRERMRGQAGLSGVDHGVPGGGAPPDVRPPAGAVSPVPGSRIRQRGEGQRFN